MSDALFRATSLAYVDPAWIDAQVVHVLHGMFGGEWAPCAPAGGFEGYVLSQVSVDGLTQDRVMVAVSPPSCRALKEMLDAKDIADDELVNEVANVIAGHVKTALADGLSTGIPVAGEPPRLTHGGYRMAFARGRAVVEVASGG